MNNQSSESIIILGDSFSLFSFLLCISTSLVLGFLIAQTHMIENTYTKGFINTLALLPASVSIVIIMVNGNIGSGVAIAGAFSLIRFRSMAATSREINSIFLSMAIGLACGMGYIGYAVIFTILISIVSIIYLKSSFGDKTINTNDKTLKISIPENLNYSEVFD